jgi:hypothetical protein
MDLGLVRSLWGAGLLGVALVGACSEAESPTYVNAAGSGGNDRGGSGGKAASGQAGDDASGQAGNDNAGGSGTATGGAGGNHATGQAGAGGSPETGAGAGGAPSSSGGAGGAGPACTDEELFAGLPDHFTTALGDSACLPGDTGSSAGADITYCDDLPCSCMADLLWQASVDGSTFTATAGISDMIPIDYEILNNPGSCVGTFSADLTYTATLSSSNEGGELHTVASAGSWTIENETLSGCAALSGAYDFIASSIAADMLANFQALDVDAIVAGNTCP